MRIVMRIIDAAREEVGADAIVGLRLNSDDGMQGGLGPVEWAEIAKHLAATGKLDYISCSHGTYLNRMMIYSEFTWKSTAFRWLQLGRSKPASIYQWWAWAASRHLTRLRLFCVRVIVILSVWLVR